MRDVLNLDRRLGATWFAGYENSVQNAMPPGIPDKLALSKMRALMRRGLVDGCACGCRGDFTLSIKGEDLLEAADQE
jgi:hypothetical protein